MADGVTDLSLPRDSDSGGDGGISAACIRDTCASSRDLAEGICRVLEEGVVDDVEEDVKESPPLMLRAEVDVEVDVAEEEVDEDDLVLLMVL